MSKQAALVLTALFVGMSLGTPIVRAEDTVALTKEERVILVRKAHKYGINPNLLEAIVTLECRAARKNVASDPQAFTWLSEQSARVVHHVLTKTKDLKAVLRYYAAGSFSPEDSSPAAVSAFVKESRRLFQQLEKVRPWDGRYRQAITGQ